MVKRSKTGFKAVAGGIALNRELRVVSGCRVQFDPRDTEQANDTRSTVNRKGGMVKSIMSRKEED